MANTIRIGTFEVSSFKVGLKDPKIYLGDTLLYPKSQPTIKNYLRFIATNSGTFTFNGNDIDYSLDSGATWTTLSNGNATPTITAGSSILWKASGLTPTSFGGIGAFSSTANFTAEGNVMSLLYGDDFEGQTSLSGKNNALRNLFSGCTGLISVENLVLPATTLAKRCYYSMFYRCTSLTTPPTLPATTLATGCYYSMFYQCSSLTTSPVLSAETLVQDCYRQMFYNCRNLNKITCLATDISASNCTNNWVANVASSGTFYKASGMSSWTTGNSGIPSGWTKRDYNPYEFKHLTFTAKSSGTFTFTPKEYAASGNVISYSLDSGSTWTSANTTTTVQSGDTVFIKGENFGIHNNGIGTFSSTTNFDVEGNVMSLLYGDNFENQTSLSGKNYAFMNLFSGCTTVINAENLVLPATTLSNYCYCNMFNRAINLVKAPSELPATTLGDGCYMNMFYNCGAMTTVMDELPATTLAASAYTQMFTSCSGFTTAPILPAAVITTYGYYRMFYNCINLNKMTCLATDISASNCTNNWVANVAASGTFYKASGMSYWARGVNGIPKNWTVVDYSG